ncbi:MULTISPECIES: glycerophosphodiester phosphodiesterase [Cohnella]|uniref:Glycerophosphoryl diester phosphodiesterase n=1 Tax=Cohnella phaseoli TaxID=456490 RepID=A0A3D9KCS8_9BACL|nr:glycerophosphodiester phosphodiesterase family protein [Cohnella phaseoli]RED84341.1 glycerophosphoryl diester phosphodiesterase [Cohnella phaseoli]
MLHGIKSYAKGLRNLPFRFHFYGRRGKMDKQTKAALHPCVAHRGFSGKAPENTLAAFKLALSHPHVKWMELDVHLSKDGVPVVIHDGTLERTTNGRGRVADYSAEQLASLDAGSWMDASFSSEGVPTLEQVLDLAAGRCKLNIELKSDDADFERLASRAVEVIRSRKMEAEHTITSFEPAILRAVRKAAPELRIGLIIDDNPDDLVERLISLDCSYLSIGFYHLNEKLLEQTAKASIEVMAWTVNSVSDLGRLAARPEAFQLCTNYPDRWLAVVEGED